MKFEFSGQIFDKKYLKIKFHENPSRGNRVVPCEKTDGQTEILNGANTSFAQRAPPPARPPSKKKKKKKKTSVLSSPTLMPEPQVLPQSELHRNEGF